MTHTHNRRDGGHGRNAGLTEISRQIEQLFAGFGVCLAGQERGGAVRGESFTISESEEFPAVEPQQPSHQARSTGEKAERKRKENGRVKKAKQKQKQQQQQRYGGVIWSTILILLITVFLLLPRLRWGWSDGHKDQAAGHTLVGR